MILYVDHQEETGVQHWTVLQKLIVLMATVNSSLTAAHISRAPVNSLA